MSDRFETPEVDNAAQLVAHIEKQIATGEMKPGYRLEPVRTLARAVGLSPNTVAVAYRRLGERGHVYSRGRLGTFVADRPALGSTKFEPLPAGLIDLANGNPDPALLPSIKAAATSALETLGSQPVLYGTPSVDEALGEVLGAELEGELGSLLEAGIEPGRNLSVVGGALDGIERVLAAHVAPGDLVAVEDPGYHSVFDLLRAMNLRPVPVPVDARGVMVDRLAGALDRGARVLIVTPRAQNPTGSALDSTRAGEVSAVLEGYRSCVVIEDDHAGAIAGSDYHRSIPDGHPSWAVIRSVAKSLGPDLRVAALAGDDATVAKVIGRQSLGTGWVSHLLQRTAANLLADPATVDMLKIATRVYAERRQAMVQGLARHGIELRSESGLNVWLPVDDEAQVVAAMQQRGYAIGSGARFRLESQSAVRVSIASHSSEVLFEVSDALADVLHGGRAARQA